MLPPLPGQEYMDFMAELTTKRPIRNYLEVGVHIGRMLSRITADYADAVDPSFQLTHNVALLKKRLTLHQCTSDEFFARAAPAEPYDLVFLDGLHQFEFLLRDFYNAERLCSPQSLIVMHDCFPLTEAMAERDPAVCAARGASTPYGGAWTGDVWKVLPILQRYRPDLKVVCLNCEPTGLVCVTGLDPASTVLRDEYVPIVTEYAALPNTWDEIEAVNRSVEMVDAARVSHGLDHSLFFAC